MVSKESQGKSSLSVKGTNLPGPPTHYLIWKEKYTLKVAYNKDPTVNTDILNIILQGLGPNKMLLATGEFEEQ
jgi:hypothetical protein